MKKYPLTSRTGLASPPFRLTSSALLWTAIAALPALSGCSQKDQAEEKKAAAKPPAYTQAAAPAPAKTLEKPILLAEKAADRGIDFVHDTGAAGKKLMPESMGSGCALFDYDGDGKLDALFADGRPLEAAAGQPAAAAPPKAGKRPAGKSAAAPSGGRPIAKLYRNDGERFKDITAAAGLNALAGYGMGVAAADYWSTMTGSFFADAPYHQHADPLERVLGYLDFRRAILQGTLPEFTCLAGTLLQEVHQSSPAIAAACDAAISLHAERLEADIAAAMAQHGLAAEWTAASLALYASLTASTCIL